MGLNSKSRVVVVGTSGAGKSHLAGRLSDALGVRDIELDELHWGPNWAATPLEQFREKIRAAISGDHGWVIHGNYTKVRDLTFANADTMIWLDYSRPVVFWRVFKRSVLRILTRKKLWAGNQESFRKTFFSRESIILWSINTYARRKKLYEQFMTAPEYARLKKLRFKTPRELEAFMNEIFSADTGAKIAAFDSSTAIPRT